MCTLFAPHHASLVISLLLWNSSASGGITRILTPGGKVRTLSITKSVHKRQRIPKKTFSLPSSVCVPFSPQTVLFPQTVQIKKNKTKQLRQINWVEHLKQNYTNSCNLMNLLNSKKLTLLETNEIKLLSQPTCWWGQLSSVPSNFKYDMDTRTVGAGQQLLSFRGCTKCAKQGERDCVKGVCDWLTIQMRKGWWGEGVTVVFQAPCLQKQPCLHLGTTGDMTAIRSLCSWLIVHGISMEYLIQGPVCPVPYRCADVKNGIHELIFSKDHRVRNSLFSLAGVWLRYYILPLCDIYVFYKQYRWYSLT